MNTATHLIIELAAVGIRLSVNGDKLRAEGPVDLLTDALRAQLASHKSELMALLALAPIGTVDFDHDSQADLTPITPPVPVMPEAWFIPDRRAPSRDLFPTDVGGLHFTDGSKGPDWIDYLYELHNRGLIMVNGRIMPEATP